VVDREQRKAGQHQPHRSIESPSSGGIYNSQQKLKDPVLKLTRGTILKHWQHERPLQHHKEDF
jgi:hypothetical protein